MAADKQTGENGRASKRTRKGQFSRGGAAGPGRKPGKPNRATLDARELRQRILDSWAACHGDEMLIQLAKDHPREYLKLVAALLPRATEIELRDHRPMFVQREVDFDATRVCGEKCD